MKRSVSLDLASSTWKQLLYSTSSITQIIILNIESVLNKWDYNLEQIIPRNHFTISDVYSQWFCFLSSHGMSTCPIKQHFKDQMKSVTEYLSQTERRFTFAWRVKNKSYTLMGSGCTIPKWPKPCWPSSPHLPAEQDLRLIRVTRDTKHIRNQISIKAENGTQCQHHLSHYRRSNHLFLN